MGLFSRSRRESLPPAPDLAQQKWTHQYTEYCVETVTGEELRDILWQVEGVDYTETLRNSHSGFWRGTWIGVEYDKYPYKRAK